MKTHNIYVARHGIHSSLKFFLCHLSFYKDYKCPTHTLASNMLLSVHTKLSKPCRLQLVSSVDQLRCQLDACSIYICVCCNILCVCVIDELAAFPKFSESNLFYICVIDVDVFIAWW